MRPSVALQGWSHPSTLRLIYPAGSSMVKILARAADDLGPWSGLIPVEEFTPTGECVV